jgi:NAD(P)-dependent dehydrogenase (short-subunit alcohol dehydrogenase family)
MNTAMLDFSGKVVFLTGGGGEIGAHTAELFLRQGAKVISTDVGFPVPIDSADFAANPATFALDVTDRSQVEAAMAAVEQNYGRIDIVVNAAGVLNIRPFLEISEQEWERTFAVNVMGVFFVCQEALKRMIHQGSGCFVNFASISGKVGGVLAGADYSASKAAVICLTKSLAKAGAPHGIRANSVAPGAITSPMLDLYYQDHAEEMKGFEKNHPLGRFGRAEEVAGTVLFLASEQASYITGACLDINGGTLMD